MRRHLILVAMAACAITAARTGPSPVAMDPFGIGHAHGITEINAAGPASTPDQAEHAQRVSRATSDPGTAAGSALTPGGAGVPTAGVHGGAGATAERFGEKALAGSFSRRHRAPSFLFDIVSTAAGFRGVPIHILAGLAEDESSWNPSAVAEDGGVGLLQLSPGVAEWCGVTDRLDAAQSADCGARYLYAQFELFGSWELALAAYKCGPARVPEDIPAEAWRFVQRTLAKAEAYR